MPFVHHSCRSRLLTLFFLGRCPQVPRRRIEIPRDVREGGGTCERLDVAEPREGRRKRIPPHWGQLPTAGVACTRTREGKQKGGEKKKITALKRDGVWWSSNTALISGRTVSSHLPIPFPQNDVYNPTLFCIPPTLMPFIYFLVRSRDLGDCLERGFAFCSFKR